MLSRARHLRPRNNFLRHLSTPASSPITQPAPSSTAPLDLFEDEILNHLFSPRTASPMPVIAPGLSHLDLYKPTDEAQYARQVSLEENVLEDAVARLRKESKAAAARGDIAAHRPAAALLESWFNPLALALRQSEPDQSPTKRRRNRRTAAKPATPSSSNTKPSPDRKTRGRRTILNEQASKLSQLPPDMVSILTIHVALSALMRDANGIPLTRLAFEVGNAVHAEINMARIGSLRRAQEVAAAQERANGSDKSCRPAKKPRSVKAVLRSALSSSHSVASAVNYAAQQVAVKDAVWSDRDTILVGSTLIEALVKVAKVQDAFGKFVPAFQHFRRFRKSDMVQVGCLQLTDAAISVIMDDDKCLGDFVVPKQQPMLVRPKPWVSLKESPYLTHHVNLVRTEVRSIGRLLESALDSADLTVLHEGLNALGDTEWRVNRGILDAATVLWERGGGVAGLVTKTDVHVPQKKEFLEAERRAFEANRQARQIPDRTGDKDEIDGHDNVFDENRAKWRLKMARRRAQKLNRELVSQRADLTHRMECARKFADEERIWLPHNVDFRGRAYPIPVYLQHMGCDLTRATLTFAEPGIELGPRGVYWLKVHLANKLGADKLSFSDRVAFAEDNMAKAISTGRDPLSESNLEWWGSAEDPFQVLAVCQEFANGFGRYGGETALERYESTLPISMDGSCNGLQHYAALGRDVEGGTQVNLVPNDKPQDVYSGVAKLVNKRVDEMAVEGDELGLLLQGKITRKVVKQTVMTSVYGVTLIGARKQIGNRLAEIPGFPEDKIFAASLMLASLTLSSLGDIFTGATRTMDWLYDTATRISKEGHEVQWTTPVGLPAVQPYRQGGQMVVKTLMQRVTLERNGEHTAISTARQRSAFAPNYVHSIDSAHMIFTAIQCQKAGMQFAAVHDSFWTNAAHVDRMNVTLRDEFVKLHSRDLLEELRESFLIRYPGITFAKVPPRGKLDLDIVRDSPYFFS